MPISMGEVVVAGSGAGGLAAALAIARQRHRVLVLGDSDPFVPPDAGVHLTPGVLRALDRIGVGLDARDRAATVGRVHVVDGVTGQPITTMPAASRHGRPHAVVRGRDLLELLRRRCRTDPAIRLREDASVVGYEQSDERLTVRLSTGERLAADALVGADGVCSQVRLRLTGATRRTSPYATFHTTFPADRMPVPPASPFTDRASVTLWAGPDWQLVRYPAGEDRVGVAANCPHDADTLVPGARVPGSQVLLRLPGLTESAQELVSLGTDWRMWVPCDPAPLTRWHDRRVVLTGAAVRPAFLCAFPAALQAVDDAVRLADVMDCDAADFPEAFRSYAVHRV
ncbi:FAD-dependent monooxygenase [Streptomyces griseosporeus]|uniref:FAD-dependent monooxygenase n=1 Tax=Streptomyces griseosporeus TaxID=1910 RepID=UPI0036FE029E